VFEDRRPMALLKGDRELAIASVIERAAMGARHQREQIGTAGDRVVMSRVLWHGGPPDGRFEIEYLAVLEVDEAGLLVAFVLMDPEDPRAVQREAWARWAKIDPHVLGVVVPFAEMVDAFNEQDADKWRAQLAEDLVVVDHRLAGMGRIDGADAYTTSIVALWELAPVTRAETGWVWSAFDHCGGVTTLRRIGTVPDGGGEFESECLYLYLVTEAHITHVELFELDALDEALARFNELRPDPLRIPPNAARLALEQIHRIRASGDFEALRDLATDDFCFDDRQRRSLVRGGVEEWLRALQFLWAEAGARLDTRPIATAGDRLAVDRALWSEAPDDGPFEMESLRLVEVDAAGKLRALVLFDADDRAAAVAELFERYLASGAEGMPSGAIEFLRGWNEHDFDRTRSGLCDDLLVDDRRFTGMGRLEGADAYIASVAALLELIPDATEEFLYNAAVSSRGRVSVMRRAGTNTEGGAVESLYVLLMLYRDEKIARFEVFELEQLDVALARFEELSKE
jgi:hypothetical protein